MFFKLLSLCFLCFPNVLLSCANDALTASKVKRSSFDFGGGFGGGFGGPFGGGFPFPPYGFGGYPPFGPPAPYPSPFGPPFLPPPPAYFPTPYYFPAPAAPLPPPLPPPPPPPPLPLPSPIIVTPKTAAALSVASLLHALIAKKFFPPIIPVPVVKTIPIPVPFKVPVEVLVDRPIPVQTHHAEHYNGHRHGPEVFPTEIFEKQNHREWDHGPIPVIVNPEKNITILKPVNYNENSFPADPGDSIDESVGNWSQDTYAERKYYKGRV